MRRFLFTTLIFLELTAMAVLGVAVRYGRFDQGAGFYVYLLGALAGVAIVTGFAIPAGTGSRFAVHGVLLLGCAAFSLPFVWLLSTSFKYDEELLASPPRWAPSIPPVVDRSPYLTNEASPPVEPPDNARDWEAVWPKLDLAMWERARPLL